MFKKYINPRYIYKNIQIPGTFWPALQPQAIKNIPVIGQVWFMTHCRRERTPWRIVVSFSKKNSLTKGLSEDLRFGKRVQRRGGSFWIGCCLKAGAILLAYLNRSYLPGREATVRLELQLSEQLPPFIRQEKNVFGTLC